MSSYQTIVVGTDGSERSMRAVDHAAALAAAAEATLVIVCAYHPAKSHVIAHAGEVLSDQAFLVSGSQPAERSLRTAVERAKSQGAGKIEERAVEGDASEVLEKVVSDHEADLLVVGNRGLNSIAGRLLGSVPSEVARNAGCDVMIVRTK